MRDGNSHPEQAEDENSPLERSGRGEFALRNPARRYQVTVWSNSKAGSGAGASGSNIEVWSHFSQAGGPRAGESTGGLVGSPPLKIMPSSEFTLCLRNPRDPRKATGFRRSWEQGAFWD